MALAAPGEGASSPPAPRSPASATRTSTARDFRCDHVHGTVNLVQAIAASCDIYFYELGARLDIDDIHAAAKKYGLVEETGIDLPHEGGVPGAGPGVEAAGEEGEVVRRRDHQRRHRPGAPTASPPSPWPGFYGMIATRGQAADSAPALRGPPGQQRGHPVLPAAPAPGHGPWTRRSGRSWTRPCYEVVHSGHRPLLGPARGDHRRQDRHQPGDRLRGQVPTMRPCPRSCGTTPCSPATPPRENPQIAFAVVAENAGFGSESAAPVVKKLCQYWFVDRLRKPLPPPGAKLPDAFRLDAGDDGRRGAAAMSAQQERSATGPQARHAVGAHRRCAMRETPALPGFPAAGADAGADDHGHPDGLFRRPGAPASPPCGSSRRCGTCWGSWPWSGWPRSTPCAPSASPPLLYLLGILSLVAVAGRGPPDRRRPSAG